MNKFDVIDKIVVTQHELRNMLCTILPSKKIERALNRSYKFTVKITSLVIHISDVLPDRPVITPPPPKKRIKK